MHFKHSIVDDYIQEMKDHKQSRNFHLMKCIVVETETIQKMECRP